METVFLALCAAGAAYCVLYGAYCISEGKGSSGTSAMALGLLAAFSAVLLGNMKKLFNKSVYCVKITAYHIVGVILRDEGLR